MRWLLLAAVAGAIAGVALLWLQHCQLLSATLCVELTAALLGA